MEKLINWIKENRGLFTIIIVVVAFIVVPLGVYVLSVPAVFPRGDNDWSGFWGGYLGAIIGAMSTVFGVIVTLKETREQTKTTLEETRQQFKEDKRIEHAPLLKITETSSKHMNSLDDIIYLLDQNNNQRVATCLNIKNVGLGPVTYFEHINFCFINNIGDKCPNLNGFTGEGYCKEVIEVGNEFSMPIEIDFRIPFNKEGWAERARARMGSLTFDIIYNDIFDNKYKQEIKLDLNIDVDITQCSIIDVKLELSNIDKAELLEFE